MERINTYDPLVSPRSTDTESQDDHSDDGSPEFDLSRLENVYQALMTTLLSYQAPTLARDPLPPGKDIGDKVVDAVGGNTVDEDGGDRHAPNGAVKNAKRRKMDKKKAKREEQKQGKEEVVDSVEFKLFSRKPVKQISLLPSEDPSCLTPNPRHVPLSEEGTRELRDRIGSVVVDGADVLAAGIGRSKRKLQEYKVGSECPSNIINLQIPQTLPPFSRSYALTHPAITQPPQPFLGRKHPQPTSKPLDPIILALKRGPHHKSTRTAVHVHYTNNGKILPASLKKEASAGSLSLMDGRKANQGSRAEEKAHLRRIARRAHRLNLIPAPPTHPHAHIPSSASFKPPTPWTDPFLGAHRFWAPAEGTGGKSGGYAVGFVGSLEGVREAEAGRRKGGVYLRDRMR